MALLPCHRSIREASLLSGIKTPVVMSGVFNWEHVWRYRFDFLIHVEVFWCWVRISDSHNPEEDLISDPLVSDINMARPSTAAQQGTPSTLSSLEVLDVA
jgi:hypothetical protein